MPGAVAAALQADGADGKEKLEGLERGGEREKERTREQEKKGKKLTLLFLDLEPSEKKNPKSHQGDFGRVFEVTPVFRAEKSFTHRHLTEFTGLDFEMCIYEHYDEVLEVLDRLFVSLFDGLNERCGDEIAIIGKQFPAPPLRYLRKTLILTFEEGIKMLKEGGFPDIDPMADLNTEVERALGKLVADRYHTDFFILKRYPAAVRPFYTMPDPVDPRYSNSYDVFIRGEEIISGAQRVHCAEMLRRQAERCGIVVESIRDYINSFKWGSFPHGGAGVGLERVVMLFLGLDNIRKTSLFPRDPKRLTP